MGVGTGRYQLGQGRVWLFVFNSVGDDLQGTATSIEIARTHRFSIQMAVPFRGAISSELRWQQVWSRVCHLPSLLYTEKEFFSCQLRRSLDGVRNEERGACILLSDEAKPVKDVEVGNRQ